MCEGEKCEKSTLLNRVEENIAIFPTEMRQTSQFISRRGNIDC